MKPFPTLFAFILVLSACHKEVTPNPSPCAGVTIDTTPAKLAWSVPVKTDAKPIFFKNQIFFINPLISGHESSLNCYDANTGELKWQKNLPAFLLGDQVKLKDSSLYYISQTDKSLRSFDLQTQEDKAVAVIETEGYLESDIVMGKDYAIISDISYSQTSDSTEVKVHLVNLPGGAHRCILKFHTDQIFNGEVIRDPVTEIIPNGDTLFCFIEFVYDPALTSTSFRFVSLNVGNGSLMTTLLDPSHYPLDHNALILSNGKAYYPTTEGVYCVDPLSLKVIWKRKINDYFSGELALHAGKIIAYDRYTLTALNPLDGEIAWESAPILGSVMEGNSVVQDTRLFFVVRTGLASIDLETGCLMGLQNVSGAYLLPQLAKSADGKMFYVCDFDNLIALNITQ